MAYCGETLVYHKSKYMCPIPTQKHTYQHFLSISPSGSVDGCLHFFSLFSSVYNHVITIKKRIIKYDIWNFHDPNGVT